MSGRLRAYLHATALSLLVITGAVALWVPAWLGQVAGAGLLLLGHLALWARASSVAFQAVGTPGGERALRGLGVRPFATLPLFVVLVLSFGAAPVALAACQVVGGALLCAVSDMLQRQDAWAAVHRAPAGLEGSC
ncbi:MAG TPA: hypothetical protein PKA64_06445 [Myxococcota bacterium]|nr:hypothetical protein [Myxococcota bacterium]